MAFDPLSLSEEDVQLQEILNYATDPQTRKAAREAQGFRNKLIQAGIEPEETVPRESLFTKALNVILTPQRAVQGVVDAVVNRPDVFQKDGILGGAIAAAGRGIDERISGADILRRAGVESPATRAVAGFAADMILDPISWLSFGASGAARAGGVALTDKGVDTVNLLRQKWAGQSALLGDTFADHIFKSADELTRKMPLLKAAGEAGAGQYAKRVSELTDIVKPAMEAVGLTLDDVPSLLAKTKPQVKVGLSLPFLGHFQSKKSALKELSKDPVFGNVFKEAQAAFAAKHPIRSAVGKTFRGAGAVLNPGRIDVGTFDIPDSVVKAFDIIRQSGTDLLTNLTAKTLAATDNVPGVRKVARGTEEIVKATKNWFDSTFRQATYLGPDATRAGQELKAALSGADTRAAAETVKLWGDDLLDPVRAADLEEALLVYDGAITAPIKNAVANNPDWIRERANLLKMIQRSSDGLLPAEEAARYFDDIENKLNISEQLESGLSAILADPSIRPGVKSAVQRVHDAFRQIAANEHAQGIRTGILSVYIPHRYEAIARSSSSGLSQATKNIQRAKPGFQKRRIYTTLDEAWENGGLVGKTNVAELYRDRLAASYRYSAKRAYFHRMVIENGLPKEWLQRLAHEAAMEPGGPASQLMRRAGFEPPTQFDKELVKQMEGRALKAKQGREAVVKAAVKKFDETIPQVLDDLPPFDDVFQAGKEFAETTREQLLAAGMKPVDSSVWKSYRGEIGEVFTDLDGKEYYLPSHITRALQENIAGRDMIRDMFGEGSIGRKLVDLNDSATRFFRKMVTLPWPAYWAGNLIGDGFFRFADGGLDALDPGVMGRLLKTLNGEATFANAAGGIINKQILEQAFQAGGLRFSVDEMLSAIDAYKATDIEQYMKLTQNPLKKNLMAGDIMVSLKQAQNHARDTFETMMRATHVFHRLEKGDTIGSAIARANDVMINYRDMTQWEQSIARRVFPFYMWLSRATKKQLTAMMSSPGDIGVQLKAARSLSEFFSSPDAAPTADEFDVKLLENVLTNEQVGVPLGYDDEGKTITGRVNALPINTLLSTFSAQMPRSFTPGEIADAVGDSAWRTIEKSVALSNPIFKAAAEKFARRNLYFDKPLNSDFLRKVPSIMGIMERISIFPLDQIPSSVWETIDDVAIRGFLKGVPNGKGQYVVDPGRFWMLMQIPGISRLVSSTRNIPDENVPFAQSVLPFFTPIKVSPADPSATWLAQVRSNLQEQYINQSVRQRLDNMAQGIE